MGNARRHFKRSWKQWMTLLALITVFFAFANFFIMRATMAHEEMSDCPFMSQTASMCPMSSDKQIEIWGTLLKAQPQKFSLDLILLALTMLGFLLMIQAFDWRMTERLKLILLRLYERGSPHVQLFNHIKQLFGRGLLHSKIFDYPRI